MTYTRKTLAAAIDEYDSQIEDLQDGKRDTFKEYRAALSAGGMDKEAVSKEIDAFKTALRKRRKIKEDPQAVEAKDDLVDEILAELSAEPRAPRATRVATPVPNTNRKTEPLPPKGGTETLTSPASGGGDNAGDNPPPPAVPPCKDDSTQGKHASDPEGAKSETTPNHVSLAGAREGGNIAYGKSEEAVQTPPKPQPEAQMPRAPSSGAKTAAKLPIPGPENGRYARGGGEFKQRDMPEFLRRDGKKAEAAPSV